MSSEYISGFSPNQIFSEVEIYGYKGNTVEQVAKVLIKRGPFFAMSILIILLSLGLMMNGYAFYGVVIFVCHLFYSIAVTSDRENTSLPAKLPPMMKRYLKRSRTTRLLAKLVRLKLSDHLSKIGYFYIGYDVQTKKHLYKSSGELLTHTLILAGSGSGKTVLIISVFLCNVLSLGSGMWKMDFKGTVRLLGEYYSLFLRFGRPDCVRIENYNEPQKNGSVIKNSNSVNSFLTNSPYTSFMAVDALMDSGNTQSNDPFFKDNALKILRTLLPALHDLQSKNLLRISPSVIRSYLTLKNFLALYHDPRLSQKIKDNVLVPTYKDMKLNYENKENEQTEDNERLFSNFGNNLAPTLQFLMEEFPQIRESLVSEFNPIDIITNRRGAVSIVPNAAKSDGDIKSIAQSTLNMLRSALGVG